jgi:RNA polymerase sigma-70 factor (ECF subfamily)
MPRVRRTPLAGIGLPQILSRPRAFTPGRPEDHLEREVPKDSDEALVLRYQRGDVAGFEALLDRHRAGVFRFLVRFVGDRSRAEDLAQECWMRVIAAAPRWQERARFKTWLYAVARNLATDEARRAAHRQHRSLDGPIAGAPSAWESVADGRRSPEDVANDALIRPALERAIAQLPPEQREVFLLREYEGVAFADIAEITGAPVPTVKSRMRYALEALRAELERLDVVAGAEGETAEGGTSRSARP